MPDANFPSTVRAFSHEEPAGEPNRFPRRRRRVVAIVIVAPVLAALLAGLIVRGIAPPGPAPDEAAPLVTVPVTTGDMVSATNARATLHYSQENPLPAASGGIVTALPAAGTVIAPGGTLYRINNVPVVLLHGTAPAWRSFEIGMTPGEDVRQLEQNLAALAGFSGDVDTTFTNVTATAISAWQKSQGLERTGTLDRTQILFSDHDLRVAPATTRIGADIAAGTALYAVSATDKIVDLDLRLGDQKLAVVGNPVGITLPDGTATTGSIATVGEPVERASDDAEAKASEGAGGTFVVPVTVTLSDQAAVGAFTRASVTVQFSSALADGVLTVPVEALVAIDANTFVVQTPTKSADERVRTIPVTVGAFASGRVQITGKDITEGLEVVVPES